MNITKPLKLTLVISSLSSGGAERVMSVMANYWAAKGWNITLITLDSVSNDFYELDPRVERVGLAVMGESQNDFRAIMNNIYRILRLRHAIRESTPDVVVSFVDRMNVLTLLATRGLGLEVVVCERTDPSHHEFGRHWSWLCRVTYPWADIIAAQNNQVKRWLEETFAEAKIVVIPNPITYENGERGYASLSEIIGREKNKRTVVAMGRLGVEKGFDMLIKAFGKIAHSNPEWRLVIFGEGKERNALGRLVSELGVEKRVFLPGRVDNPFRVLKDADFFVMSSRYEGFPNSLVEAMSCGLPVISFDCPSGPREIIRDGVDGLLVPPKDVDALAEAMNRLMSEEAERKRLAARGPDVMERFGLGKIMAMWEETICKILEKK
jgi:GalNAc-alpha-(1->4)-GalNAc-alpha-(1->3)-diNAcBac-PP-undecaprenol alpha-1,4-N-acetyl-D-galactosaminyltransferase